MYAKNCSYSGSGTIIYNNNDQTGAMLVESAKAGGTFSSTGAVYAIIYGINFE